MTDKNETTGPHCPCCGASANSLALLAEYFDLKYPDNPNTEVQDDLRKWAKNIRAINEPGGTI